MSYYYGFRPYVSVAERQRKAEHEMQKLRKKGHPVSPVVIDGRTIAKTFWGKAWCENLERYSDFENRLPRGRTYVRNGSVVDLQVAPGKVNAVVSGSELYNVTVKVSAVPAARWKSICADCAGGIDSLVELLQGRFSQGVMERICQEKSGLFPSPAEIQLSCSCPDWAKLCKHVAAVLYGMGARLDQQPELLFKLRDVDEKELIAKAGTGLRLSAKAPRDGKLLDGDLSDLFGLDLGTSDEEPVTPQKPGPGAKPKKTARKGKTSTAAKTRATVATGETTRRARSAPGDAQTGTATPTAVARTRAKPTSAIKSKPTSAIKAKPTSATKAKPKNATKAKRQPSARSIPRQ